MNLSRTGLMLIACQVFTWTAYAAEPVELVESVKTPAVEPAKVALPKTGQVRPFVVALPPGWEVSELNAPKPNNGNDIAGGRLRALKKDGDAMAVIEITYLSREDAGKADIDSEFSSFVSTVKSEYENKGLKTSTTPTRKATLGALPSSEVELTVVGQNKELRQWFGMAMGQKYVYALSYTGEKQYYDRFAPEFAKCRSSLEMK